MTRREQNDTSIIFWLLKDLLSKTLLRLPSQTKQYNAVSGTMEMMRIGQDIQNQLKSGAITEEQAVTLMQGQLEKTLAALWKLNVLDIERTLDRVCTAILQQPGMLGLLYL